MTEATVEYGYRMVSGDREGTAVQQDGQRVGLTVGRFDEGDTSGERLQQADLGCGLIVLGSSKRKGQRHGLAAKMQNEPGSIAGSHEELISGRRVNGFFRDAAYEVADAALGKTVDMQFDSKVTYPHQPHDGQPGFVATSHIE
ncbi:hypothetical protein ABT297_24935 [Dactylosporangium sp. NPDC000555]|uniref:hypothetical protein n=1 Tax=Dactylosporangium sp. NPDC000555 TaxID=3154260 RepID=UPI00332C6B29